MMYNKFMLSLLLCVFAGSSFADVLFLANGDRVTGQVTAIGNDAVTIKPSYSGALKVNLADIARLETETPTELELSDGTVGSFKITGNEEAGKAKLVATEKAIDVALADIQRFGVKPKRKNWDAKLDLSSNFSRGNTDSQDTNLQGRSTYRQGEHRYKSDLLISREEKDGTKTKEKDRLKLGYNWLFDDQWFLAVDTSYERDPIAELDRRLSVTPAIGYDIWNQDGRILNVQFGVGYADERTDGEDESSANLDWKLEFSYDLLDGEMELFHNHDIYRSLSGRKNTVLNSQTGVRYKFTSNMYLNVQANYDYDTEPADGADSKDLVFMVGAGVNF